ncbi:hypothetical protein G6F22_017631 [Rhizopus arrhizus]|nr:hypothetical protein G6F22_017631 [Rhizopus arrhizus]
MPRAGGRQPQRLPGGQVPGRVLGASHPGQHGLRAGGQHVFQRDLRGDDGCLPEDVDAAADAQRVADDAAVVQGVDGVQARLDEDAHGPAVGIARRQGGQAGAQLFGGGPRLRLGAEQRAHAFHGVGNGGKRQRIAVEDGHAQLVHDPRQRLGRGGLPGDQQVGAHGGHAFGVGLGAVADDGQRVRWRGAPG